MASEKLLVNRDTIQSQLKSAVEAVLVDAQRVRVVAEAVEINVGEVFGDSEPEKVRNTGVILRAQTLGLLLELVRLSGKAERFEAIADVYDAADANDPS